MPAWLALLCAAGRALALSLGRTWRKWGLAYPSWFILPLSTDHLPPLQKRISPVPLPFLLSWVLCGNSPFIIGRVTGTAGLRKWDFGRLRRSWVLTSQQRGGGDSHSSHLEMAWHQQNRDLRKLKFVKSVCWGCPRSQGHHQEGRFPQDHGLMRQPSLVYTFSFWLLQ